MNKDTLVKLEGRVNAWLQATAKTNDARKAVNAEGESVTKSQAVFFAKATSEECKACADIAGKSKGAGETLASQVRKLTPHFANMQFKRDKEGNIYAFPEGTIKAQYLAQNKSERSTARQLADAEDELKAAQNNIVALQSRVAELKAKFYAELSPVALKQAA